MEKEGVDWAYRPHIDGLRAVAVYLVLLFHAGADRFAGGFIGVDVFFVLSGYLVTTLILRDRGRERFSLMGFYSRRVRRLLPAALVNLTITAAVFAAIASPAESVDASRAISSAALYVSNWFFIGESTNYFAADIASSPVLQYWSLSVEEQFYLVWPLALLGVYALARRFGGRQAQVVRLAVIVTGLASVSAALWMARTDPTRAYLGSTTRAYQLLAGAALALSPGLIPALRRRPRVVRALPAVGVLLLGWLVVLATSVIDVGPITRGVATTLTTVALLVALEAAPSGAGRALLSRSTMTYLGKVSYGTYLWHWLVLLVLADAYAPSPLMTAAVAIPVATGIASLSYHLLELPIRTSTRLDKLRVPVLALGVGMSLLVALVVAPGFLERPRGDGGAQPEVAASAGTPNTADWEGAMAEQAQQVFQRFDCGALDDRCQLVEGTGQTIAIVGDSHAAVLAPMLADLAEGQDASLWLVSQAGCPWTRGLRYAVGSEDCFDFQDRAFETVLPEIDPDVVILIDRAVDDPTNGLALIHRSEGALEGDPRLQRELTKESIGSVAASLRTDDRNVVIVEPIPVAPLGTNPLSCLSEEAFIEACRFVVSTTPTAEEEIIRELAEADPGVWSISLDQLVCPYLPICDPVVGGVIVRSDDNHLMAQFGRTLVDPFEQFLVENEILD